MDEATAKELVTTLQRLESKVDRVVTFVETVEGMARTWTSGGKGKMLAALARMRSGEP